MHECQITVKGDGVGRYGKPKTDKTGPLSDFLVDNSVFYAAVTKHLQKCDRCDVVEVLQTYLRRRIQVPKFKGQTSTSLMKRAVILENLARKKKVALPDGLVNAFLWRGGPYGVLEHGHRLSVRERFQAFRLTPLHESLRGKFSQTDLYLARLADSGLSGEATDAELEELVKVAEVMLS
jgi:hypothetical protein